LHKFTQLLTVPSPVNRKFEPTIVFLGKKQVTVDREGNDDVISTTCDYFLVSSPLASPLPQHLVAISTVNGDPVHPHSS
jgi:hypothetical protein